MCTHFSDFFLRVYPRLFQSGNPFKGAVPVPDPNSVVVFPNLSLILGQVGRSPLVHHFRPFLDFVPLARRQQLLLEKALIDKVLALDIHDILSGVLFGPVEPFGVL